MAIQIRRWCSQAPRRGSERVVRRILEGSLFTRPLPSIAQHSTVMPAGRSLSAACPVRLLLTSRRRAPAARDARCARRPLLAAKSLGMFQPPESLNNSRIERMTPSMNSSFSEESIGGVMRSIRALLNDSGGRNMPRVLAAPSHEVFRPTVRATLTRPSLSHSQRSPAAREG